MSIGSRAAIDRRRLARPSARVVRESSAPRPSVGLVLTACWLGLASGLINTSQQIGGALGIAVLSSVAIAQTNDAAGAGDAVPQALTSGFQAAFWVGAGIALAGVVASLVLIRKEELAAAPAFEPEAQVLAEATGVWARAAKKSMNDWRSSSAVRGGEAITGAP